MPSGHIEFHHIFQLCSDDLFRPINYSNNEISTFNEEVNNQLFTTYKNKIRTLYESQNIQHYVIRYILCQLGPFCWPGHIYTFSQYVICKQSALRHSV